MPKYTFAPEVKDIAEALIFAHHDELTDEPIRYVFRDEAAKKGGKIVRGTASILSGRAAFLTMDSDEWVREVGRQETPSLFIIEIAKDVWDVMSDQEKQALVDHELSHCKAADVEKGKGEDTRKVRSLSIQGHDIEEFTHIVLRYGLWQEDLNPFAEACKEAIDQPSLLRDNLNGATEISDRSDEERQTVTVSTGGRKKK